MVSWTSQVQAEPEVQAIQKGKAAPFDGVVYSKAAHAKLVAKLQTSEKRCKLDIKTALAKQKTESDGKIRVLKINLEVAKKRLELTVDLAKTQKKILLATIPRAKTPWWKSPAFVFWSGVAAGIVVTGLATWGAVRIVQTTK